MKTDGIILDIDGTIWDSTEIVAGAWNRAMREFGLPEIVTAEKLKGLFGKPMNIIAQILLPDLEEETRDELMRKCCVYEHEALMADPCRIAFPGVVESIRLLSEKIPVYIVSNCQKGYIELVMEKTGITDCITDHECYGETLKGKAENIRLLSERNNIEYPVYVGDTDGDREACEEAGVRFIHAAYGFGRAERADARISSFCELVPLTLEGEV
ncbi:MAG: HAD family hydrolase [Lachnospiraceae bacterium]|nr:HAD family hydrolase [Lachnospiraceae bacterium]